MNTDLSGSHPTDDMLLEYALENKHENLTPHISRCSACSKFIEEIGSLKEKIRDIEDERVPLNIRRKVLGISRASVPVYKIWEILSAWYRNPFILISGIALFATFLYFFFEYVLSR